MGTPSNPSGMLSYSIISMPLAAYMHPFLFTASSLLEPFSSDFSLPVLAPLSNAVCGRASGQVPGVSLPTRRHLVDLGFGQDSTSISTRRASEPDCERRIFVFGHCANVLVGHRNLVHGVCVLAQVRGADSRISGIMSVVQVRCTFALTCDLLGRIQLCRDRVEIRCVGWRVQTKEKTAYRSEHARLLWNWVQRTTQHCCARARTWSRYSWHPTRTDH